MNVKQQQKKNILNENDFSRTTTDIEQQKSTTDTHLITHKKGVLYTPFSNIKGWFLGCDTCVEVRNDRNVEKERIS